MINHTAAAAVPFRAAPNAQSIGRLLWRVWRPAATLIRMIHFSPNNWRPPNTICSARKTQWPPAHNQSHGELLALVARPKLRLPREHKNRAARRRRVWPAPPPQPKMIQFLAVSLGHFIILRRLPSSLLPILAFATRKKQWQRRRPQQKRVEREFVGRRNGLTSCRS